MDNTWNEKAELEEPFSQCREMSSVVGQPLDTRVLSLSEAWVVTLEVLDSQHCSMARAR